MAGEEPSARRRQQQQQHQQTGIDGERLLSGLIARHLEDLTVAVNEREERNTLMAAPLHTQPFVERKGGRRGSRGERGQSAFQLNRSNAERQIICLSNYHNRP